MRSIYTFVTLLGVAFSLDDILIKDDTPSSSVKAITTKSPSSDTNDDVLRVTLDRQTTTATPVITRSPSRTTSIPANLTQEGSGENSLFKLMLTMPTDDNYYNVRMNLGNENDQLVELRVDIAQPEMWVMNADEFLDCSYLSEWWSSEEPNLSTNTASEPGSLTTLKEYTATNCGKNGLYTPSPLSDQPTPTGSSNIQNGDAFVLPYMNLIDASGVWNTDNVSFNLTTGDSVKLTDVTFVNVNDTNMYSGGLGLAGSTRGTGFLNTLVDMGIINSPGYSLWFDQNRTWQGSLGQLIPGAVSTKYFTGKLISYNMLKQSGTRFPSQDAAANEDLVSLNLPIVLVSDVQVENDDTGKKLSIQSTPGGFPVLLDTRLYYSYLPLDVIVNLAVQTNAYYSNDVDRWIVECDVIRNSSASMNFLFGDLTVKVPLSEFITDAEDDGRLLYFDGGQAACFLALSPTSNTGYNSLGLPFLRHIYLAVDNEGQTLAMANTNPFLNIDRNAMVQNVTEGNDSVFSQAEKDSANTSSSRKSDNSNESIGMIKSGSIPFASPMSNQKTDVVLSFTSVDTSSGHPANLDIPARLSGAVVINGSIYVTRTGGQIITTLIPGRATAASEEASTSKSNVGRIETPFVIVAGERLLHDIYLVIGMGLAVIWMISL
ncbi:uncharacterized protein SPAPADRAFT_63658 [Spathaspora passalidarum NRRL Y-27907]|uniref:Peptidase A1 domain-containing protein n=1 Tax=Spathaspora passalidarum (strain NRRL Y-27907 / 11-Y1) TaxID=619300 RepID=G3AUV3_SPAPN|nr:uncharacterized protein SPAPADRAFT_63658 [Spathaspora passalidarum NRRL Y-27907]EGW30044.1 hypothetical protein SPAPADRAFT_63658 [Spathaspora passalidarum NRRL Y-27907]